MATPWRRNGLSALLLLLLILAVGLILSLMGGAVLIPQGGAFLVMGAGLAVFLGVQLLLFRALGLRSKADERQEEDPARDADWRAWRG
jgi:membrane protein implicated in regulation of membrane protease activity